MEDEILEQFIANLKKGIPAIESGGGDYQAQNPKSSAAGKYQFLKSHLPAIQAYAKKQGVFDEVNNMQDFKDQPELQEGFFTHYAKDTLWPQAKKLAMNPALNKDGLKVDEIGAIMHFQGVGGGRKSIVNRTLHKSPTSGTGVPNATGNKYLEVYNKGLAKSGAGNVSTAPLMSDGHKRHIYNSYLDKDKKISMMTDLTQGQREKLRDKMHYELKQSGDLETVNLMIKQENDVAGKSFLEKKAAFQLISEKLHKETLETNNKGTQTGNINMQFSKDEMEVIDKAYPTMFAQGTVTRNKGGHSSVKFSGREIRQIDGDRNNQQRTNPGQSQTFFKNFNTLGTHLFGDKYKGKLGASTNNSIGNAITPNKLDKKYATYQDDTDYNDVTVEKHLTNEIDKDKIMYRPPVDKDGGNGKTSSTSKSSSTKTTGGGADKGRENAREVEKSDPGTADADDYFATMLGNGEDTDTDFAYGKTKGNFNMDIVSGLVLGIKGMRDADDVDIPLRTEQVSDAFRSFTADLRKKSLDGLPVEVEAAMINNLNESYQGGLENLVRSSAGNRNLVLGNQGQLEVAKNKGIMQIAIADYEAKDRAFAQYGEALKHIEKVDHTREIANHGIKYNEAFKERGDAEQLAKAGFATMMEGLRYQKENAPGSANDMRRSQLMQKMYGFDPQMKDDGTGTQKGTKSYHDKNKSLLRDSVKATKDMHKRYDSMSGDQKKAFSKAILETQDKGKLNGLMDYMQQNPNANLKNMDTENFGAASSSGDYASLFSEKQRKGETSATVPQTEKGMPVFPAGSMVDQTTEAQDGSPLVNGQRATFVDNRPGASEVQAVKSPLARAKTDAAISKKQQTAPIISAVDNDNPLVKNGLTQQGPKIPSLQGIIEKSKFTPEQDQFREEDQSPLIR